MVHDAAGTVQQAGDVGAHANLVTPYRLQVIHGVEGRDFMHGNRRHFEIFRNRLDQVGREPAAVLFLRDAQRRHHRRLLALRRILGDLAVDLGARRPRQQAELRGRSGLGDHRSMSPKTMSSVPITATTSAIMWPRVNSSIADKCAKPAVRIFTRYGLLGPAQVLYTPNSPLGCSIAA